MNGKKGFMLLEIMVSIVIITASLIYVMRGYSTANYAIYRAGILFESELLLENKMFDFEERGEIENGLKEGGEFIDNKDYSWSFETALLPADPVIGQGLNINLVTLEIARNKDTAERKPYITKYFLTTYMNNKK